jgi:hypothetical protein
MATGYSPSEPQTNDQLFMTGFPHYAKRKPRLFKRGLGSPPRLVLGDVAYGGVDADGLSSPPMRFGGWKR